MTVMDMDDDKVVKEVADMMVEMKVDKFAELVTLIKWKSQRIEKSEDIQRSENSQRREKKWWLDVMFFLWRCLEQWVF